MDSIILKLVSESLLSFYPAMVKYIKYPLKTQLTSRLIIYTLIAAIFMTKSLSLLQKLLSPFGLLLAITNVFHVWTSYVGFQNLDAGVSYSIFYIYPLLIILFSGSPFRPYFLLPLLGVLLLTYSNWKEFPEQKMQNFLQGLFGIVAATLSEAALYFIVKKINNGNQWDTLFVSYFFPAIILTLFFNKSLIPSKTQLEDPTHSKQLILLLVGNAVIGAVGYYLRYYTINRLPSNIYGILSYAGIVMAYVYGALLNKDPITLTKIIGSLIIIISSVFFFH